jgi:hypothetical protein
MFYFYDGSNPFRGDGGWLYIKENDSRPSSDSHEEDASIYNLSTPIIG